VTITGGTALSDEDIEQMIDDAETHAKEDVELKKAVEARNKADHAAYQIEGQLEEHGDKLTDDERKELEDKVATVRSLLDDESASGDALNGAADDLMTGAQVLGQKVYEASQTAPEDAEASDEDSSAEADDVVEAEVVEDDDDA
jgi:molecular chaperone DnaK